MEVKQDFQINKVKQNSWFLIPEEHTTTRKFKKNSKGKPVWVYVPFEQFRPQFSLIMEGANFSELAPDLELVYMCTPNKDQLTKDKEYIKKTYFYPKPNCPSRLYLEHNQVTSKELNGRGKLPVEVIILVNYYSIDIIPRNVLINSLREPIYEPNESLSEELYKENFKLYPNSLISGANNLHPDHVISKGLKEKGGDCDKYYFDQKFNGGQTFDS